MESIQQINAHQLKSWLEQASDPPLLLDVREAWEFNLCALAGAVNIPMGQIPARLNEIDQNREIVVICHHGVRSNQVARYIATARDGGSTRNAGAVSSETARDGGSTRNAGAISSETARDGGSTRNAGAISSTQQGYAKLYNFVGGMAAWAREIDKNMRTY